MEKLTQACVRIGESTLLELKARKINISLLVRDLIQAYLGQDNRNIDNLRKDLKLAEEDERAVRAKLASIKAEIKKQIELEDKRKRKELIDGAPWREPI